MLTAAWRSPSARTQHSSARHRRRRLRREPDLHGAADADPCRGRRDAVGTGRDLLRAARLGGADHQRGDRGVRAANGAYVNTPGIFTDRHQQRWAEIADAVHAAGGRMFIQLWHVGRMAIRRSAAWSSVAPSAIAAELTTHTPRASSRSGAACPGHRRDPTSARRGFPPPRRPRPSTPGRTASRSTPPTATCCTSSSRDVTNRRDDAYGGSPRTAPGSTAEVVDAVADEIGAGRVGLRISPGHSRATCVKSTTVAPYEALLDRIGLLGAGIPTPADRTDRTPHSPSALAVGRHAGAQHSAERSRPNFCQLEEPRRVGRHRRRRRRPRLPGQPRPHRPTAARRRAATSPTSRRSTRPVPSATSTTRRWPMPTLEAA